MGIRREIICECDKCGADISFFDLGYSETSDLFVELGLCGWRIIDGELICSACYESGENK